LNITTTTTTTIQDHKNISEQNNNNNNNTVQYQGTNPILQQSSITKYESYLSSYINHLSIMAQGNGKLGKSSRVKSVGSQRRLSGKTAKKKAKGSSKIERQDSGIVNATKQINRKNERLIAAKATNAHTKFYLNDLSTKGTFF
jgi:hypothetical protein